MVGANSSDDKISNLNLGNPLHLKTSDFNSNTIISVKLTGTGNYKVWAASMKLAINTRNKTGFLDGTCLKSIYANSAPLSNQRERSNSIVLSWLLNSVSEDLFLGQIFSDNASEVWAELKETYDKLDGEDVSKHNQLIKLMQFLMGLNDVFQPIRSSLLARETLPDVKYAFAIISREESHRGIASSSSGSVTKPQVSRTKKLILTKGLEILLIIEYLTVTCIVQTVERLVTLEKGASLSFTNEQMMKLINLINEAPSGNVQANMAVTLGWIIDYGANQHMTISTLNMFGVIDITDLNLTVCHPNWTLAKIKYVGNLKLSDKKILFDVLVVPEYRDLHQNKIIGTSSKNGSLYMFDYVSPLSSNSQTIGNLSVVCFISKSIWHTRLGHPSDQVVNMLQHDINFTKDFHMSPYDICHKVKQTREPFPFSDHQTTEIDELIYLDLWGPYKFKCNIKTVRSDNGSEFVNNKMSELFNSLGIIHQTSCAYTPRQNGIAEKSFVSKWFPSSFLNGKSPFELVYGFKQKLSHLRSLDVFHSDFQTSLSPNDDGRVYDTPHNDGNDHSYLNNADECENDFATSIGHPDIRRSSTVPKMHAKFNDYVVNSSKKYGLKKYVTYTNLNTSNYCFSTNLNKSSEPTSYFEAVKNPNWIEAMNNEIEALNRNNTWTVCDLPEGRKAIGSKWLWKIKYKSSGEIKRYKARVMAKGFSQREGFDYLETFSHVVKMSTVRCMLNVAISNGWDLFQLDINNAFLYGDLSEDVYMTLPPGFDTYKSKVCKLNKSLYGLKQAPRKWNAKLTQALTEHGFVQSKFHYSLFTKNSDNVFIILLVYVDDIVVTGNNVNEIENFKQFLKSKFQIKDLEKLKYFLGIEVLNNKYGICLSQRKYCLELLHEFGLLAAKHVDTPLAENATLNHTESDDDHLLVNVSNYQRLVGKLIYLTNTRPDIPYDVHCLSQYMHYPLNSHLDATLRVLRYLKGSPGSGIQINKTGNLKLRAYADYDWARCHATRKSVSGYCVFLGDSLVTWKRKKQSSLSRSSAEAEYGNMASATFEVIWLSNLLSDMGVKNILPVVMYCDNSSALQIAAKPVFHEKSKHFEIDVHLVRKKLLMVLLN
ncbi:ribonuclease H-like domain-containing protein [Tanacetum coccineum]